MSFIPSVGDLIKPLLDKLAPSLMRIYNHIRQAIDKIIHFKTAVTSMFHKIETLVSNVETEIEAIKNFEFNPQWKTRVISVPRAIEDTQDLIDQAKDAVSAIRDLVSKFKDKLNAPEEIEPSEMEKDIEKIGEKLGKGCEKILGWLTLIVDAFLTIDEGIDDLQIIVDAFSALRNEVEHLDTLFLPQGNPKKVVDEHYRKRQRQ
jgi:hypothetical protein